MFKPKICKHYQQMTKFTAGMECIAATKSCVQCRYSPELLYDDCVWPK